MTGFTELRAPRYSKTILDADGKPALLGYFPVVADRDAGADMMFLVRADYSIKFDDEAARRMVRIDGIKEP